MKAIIIGGGIAGLTQGLLLREQGYDIRIYERTKVLESRGHAFLMSEDGLKVYERFLDNQLDGLKTKSINLFSLKRPNEEELIKIQLEGWHCLKRADFMRFLAGFFDSDTLVFDKEFSHFELTNGQFSSVVFKDGSSDTGDLFIGADGSHSAVRKFLFGDTNYTAIAVKEVVGISNYSKESSYQVFEKIQCADKGLAFGFIPATEEQSVWFMQYDASFENNRDLSSPSSLSAFCHEILKDFPAEVREVLDKNDFGNTYIWNTRDFDLLPTFHKHNEIGRAHV